MRLKGARPHRGIMTITYGIAKHERKARLLKQTVVVIGGSIGVGLETARRMRAEGAEVILADPCPDRLERVAAELGAISYAAFDTADPVALSRFFGDLPGPVDHVIAVATVPYQGHIADFDRERARRDFDEQLWLGVVVAHHAFRRMRRGGTVLFVGGNGCHAWEPGPSLVAAGKAALRLLIAYLALDVAPVRVNLITGSGPDQGRSAAGVTALAVRILADSSVNGAIFDVDYGQPATRITSGKDQRNTHPFLYRNLVLAFNVLTRAGSKPVLLCRRPG